MKAVIMAGGKGTRLASITKNEIPKPMVPVEGKPLLQWQIEAIRDYGFREILLVTGYLGEKIEEYFGDGSAFGVSIQYFREEEPLGTAGAFYYIPDMLAGGEVQQTGAQQAGAGQAWAQASLAAAGGDPADGEAGRDESFLLLFGDIFFDIDLDRMIAYHKEKEAAVTLLAHPNMHPYDSDLVKADAAGRVTGFDSKHNVRDYWYDNCVNAGIYIMKLSVCREVPAPVKTDLEHDVIAGMVVRGEAVYAYRTPEFVRDVGTVDRITKTVEDLENGTIAAKNLKKRQRAIFLDRDGVINEYRGFVGNPEELELIPTAAEAIRLINSSGYLAIVVTNQPVIARGECTEEELENIFNKMKTLLGREGAFVDDIFCCPHHPDKGFEGERIEYKIECSCRKPKPGMLLDAAEKYNISLEESWIIGDATSDLETGRRAGCHTALVMTGQAGKDGKYNANAELTAADILEAVKAVLGEGPARDAG